MRPRGPAERLEARRWRALRLLDRGLSLNEVGRTVGCAASSVMRWRDARRRGGAAALKVRVSPGRPPKLNPAQQRTLARLLRSAPESHGIRQERWTSPAVARLIRSEFGVSYHPDHAGRLMRRLSARRGRAGRIALGRRRRRPARGRASR